MKLAINDQHLSASLEFDSSQIVLILTSELSLVLPILGVCFLLPRANKLTWKLLLRVEIWLL